MIPRHPLVTAWVSVASLLAVMACEQPTAEVVKTTYRFSSEMPQAEERRDSAAQPSVRRRPVRGLQLGLSGSPSLGPSGPLVTVIFASSFLDTSCAAVSAELRRLQARHKGELRLVLKHFPARSQPEATLAAKAAIAAHTQGQFWPYYDALLARQRFDKETLRALAAETQMDLPSWEASLKDPRLQGKLKHDKASLVGLNVREAPAVFFNGRRVEQDLTAEVLERDFLQAKEEAVRALEEGVSQRALHRHLSQRHAGQAYVTTIIEGRRPRPLPQVK